MNGFKKCIDGCTSLFYSNKRSGITGKWLASCLFWEVFSLAINNSKAPSLYFAVIF